MREELNQIDPKALEEIQAFIHFGEGKDKFTYLSSGKNSDVFAYQDYAVKKLFTDASFQNDPYLLRQLNEKDSIYYPTLFAFEEGKFMVSELVEGNTFYQLDGLNGDIIRDYEKEIEKAKQHALEMGLVPSDLHLNNLMLNQNGELKIVDVGQFAPIYSADQMEFGFLSKLFSMLFSHSSHRKHKRHHRSSSDYHRKHKRHHRDSSDHYRKHKKHRHHSSHSFDFFSS